MAGKAAKRRRKAAGTSMGDAGAGTGVESEGSAAGSWLPGFHWPVPFAFSGPVSACRFEQGDVLYADRSGYGDWDRGAPCTWIQVLDPPKTARARTTEGDGNRFIASWSSPIELELDRGDGREQLKTTQGRLFTCLWRGDLSAIDPSADEPEPPVLQADLQRGLESAVPTFRKAFGAGRAGGAKDGLLLLASVDYASDPSRIKASAMRTVLEARFDVALLERVPAACEIPDGDRYHPPLVVRGLAISGADEDQVTEALKSVLYSPGGSAAALVRSDRFSLARHGRLVPLAED